MRHWTMLIRDLIEALVVILVLVAVFGVFGYAAGYLLFIFCRWLFA